MEERGGVGRGERGIYSRWLVEFPGNEEPEDIQNRAHTAPSTSNLLVSRITLGLMAMLFHETFVDGSLWRSAICCLNHTVNTENCREGGGRREGGKVGGRKRSFEKHYIFDEVIIKNQISRVYFSLVFGDVFECGSDNTRTSTASP